MPSVRLSELEEDPMAQQSFQVQDIHCGACEDAIRKSLARLNGVRVIEPDAATNRVEVVYDESQTDEAAIGERLASAGYPVVR
jgi:copper chaperone CopZ